ncbi:uncharacterized protein LOC102791118 [Tachysurus ichikawai]
MAEPTGDSFRALVHALHQLIKAYHHLNNTKISKGNTQGPMFLKRATKWLEALVKPANPNNAMGAMLYGNAPNWLHNSLQILEDHYTSMIRKTIDKINTLPLSEGNRAWEVALRWARRNLKNIKSVSIQAAHVEFQKILKQNPNPKPVPDPTPHPDTRHTLETQTPPTATPSHTSHTELENLIKQIRQTTDPTPQDQDQLTKAAIPSTTKRNANTPQGNPPKKNLLHPTPQHHNRATNNKKKATN